MNDCEKNESIKRIILYLLNVAIILAVMIPIYITCEYPYSDFYTDYEIDDMRFYIQKIQYVDYEKKVRTDSMVKICYQVDGNNKVYKCKLLDINQMDTSFIRIYDGNRDPDIYVTREEYLELVRGITNICNNN